MTGSEELLCLIDILQVLQGHNDEDLLLSKSLELFLDSFPEHRMSQKLPGFIQDEKRRLWIVVKEMIQSREQEFKGWKAWNADKERKIQVPCGF